MNHHRPDKQSPYWPTALMISDIENNPDWRTPLKRLAHTYPQAGFLLRDYNHPQRARLAMAISKECKRLQITLFIGGAPHLAQRLGRRRHSPEALMGIYNTSHNAYSVAAHSVAALHKAAQAGYGAVLISPIFTTPHHPQTPNLGAARLIAMARTAQTLGLMPYALGGMDKKQWHHLRRYVPTLGFAAQRFFQ